ncbi:FAD-binding protein [Streptomyces phaeolivaceus]|uniref:FAD-binding protein n=1 Tax=Streptomyces phaeolivaceus TaxID=2653200 RepID=A0A5P8KG91_9ACTN|nr:FAD-dependent monooxygenase [Streptomyces phaeolivaceus]QFR02162.1 FAD-binding protein [Streptomyces phaeolivaceus]
MSNQTTTRVLVVGAGPVGMVCALALNRRGIPVTVLESEPAPVRDQRAATIHPSTLEMLDALGVTEKIRAHSLLSSTYRFHDRPTGEVVAEFDLGRLKDEVRFPYVLQYEQYKLTAAIAEEYANESDFDVRFSHTLTGLTQTASGIEVEYTSPAGPERMAAAYVVGCDGGRSTVRKLAGIEFEGFTYPERFIKIATSFDLKTVKPDLAFRNYFSDPHEWANVFKVRGETPEGLWRVILPIGHDEDDATALSPARVEQRLQKFLPKTGSYDVEYRNVYPVNQRVAATFRQGRILLAGDSAHVNNPIGGMGMNGGIHDAVNLTEKLAKVIAGAAGDDLLDLYSRQRRHAAVNYVQAQTIANKRLLEERDPEVRRHNFDELRRTAGKFDTARAYMRRAALFDSLQDAAAIT